MYFVVSHQVWGGKDLGMGINKIKQTNKHKYLRLEVVLYPKIP